MKKSLLWGTVPAVGVLLLAIAIRSRGGPQAIPRPESKAPRATATAVPQRAVPRTVERPAAPSVTAQAADEARIRSTYQNFRIAIATGNDGLVRALEPVLKRDRDRVLRHAERDLARADSASDRQITLKTLEALRNTQ
jgi:hypothetical protein